MSLHRGIGGHGPVDPEPIGRTSAHEEHRVARATRLAVGTLACPSCDAPVAPAGPVSPADPLACPYCGRTGAVRDFLSLSRPTRPAHVEIRVVMRGGPRIELARAPHDRA